MKPGKKNLNLPLWAQTGHRRPTNRREFLAASSLSFSASLLLPQWAKLLLPSAEAATVCPSSSGSSMIPMVSVNLSGGAAMAANFVPMDQGGQPLPSYDVMGLGDGQVPLEMEFGNVPFAGQVNGVLISKFLQGLRERAPTALANTAFVGVCVRSRDDSNENMFSIGGLIAASGRNGALLPALGRRNGSLTGIGQASAVLSPTAPLIVSGMSSINGALGYAGAIGNTLNATQRAALAKTINRLSDAQSRRLASTSPVAATKSLVDCANKKNFDLASMTNTGVDPRQDATVAAALNSTWGISNATGDGTRELVFAAMTYNTLKGNAGAAAIELGGYDYHNNTRTTGDANDLVAGQTVGRILETAAIMQRPVFVYVTSDGAVSSTKSNDRNSVWVSDRGIAGASYILYYDPAGRRPTLGNQIGWFTSGQAAAENFVTGASPEQAAIAVFANYLKLNNSMNQFGKLVGRAFDTAKLSQVVKF